MIEGNKDKMQKDFEKDIEVDQSIGTTFRTEIYTSESEMEMVNYYANISDYKVLTVQKAK